MEYNKSKNIRGTYIENPKCVICKKDLTHKWLDGDYTLLMCGSESCWKMVTSSK